MQISRLSYAVVLISGRSSTGIDVYVYYVTDSQQSLMEPSELKLCALSVCPACLSPVSAKFSRLIFSCLTGRLHNKIMKSIINGLVDFSLCVIAQLELADCQCLLPVQGVTAQSFT